jgi:hypothetical protein
VGPASIFFLTTILGQCATLALSEGRDFYSDLHANLALKQSGAVGQPREGLLRRAYGTDSV